MKGDYEMSKETEKMFKEMHKFLEKNDMGNMSVKEMESFIEKFAEEYNSNIGESITPETAQSADDYIELAMESLDRTDAENYINKALEIEPDNLDALNMSLDIMECTSWEYYQKISAAVEKGNEIMEEKGFFDKENIGYFWGILETRPYMRLRANYMNFLIESGMMALAAKEGEELIRLCEGDNLGIRFRLMHIYAFLEEKDKALKLYKKFDEYNESQMLLPLAILYFKLGDFEKAEEHLSLLNETNKDTQEFFSAIKNDDLEKYVSEVNGYAYRPFTIDELVNELIDNSFVFSTTPLFLQWAYEKTSDAE